MSEARGPATPLPWSIAGTQGHGYTVWADSKIIFMAAEPRSNVTAARKDAAYIVHACNAYPRLVGELKRLCVEIPKQLGSDKPFDNTLLKELGE